MERTARIFIDTNLFIFHLKRTATSNLSDKIKKFFKDVEDGKFVGVCTTYTIIEYKAALKRILSEARRATVSQKEIDEEIEEFKNFLDEMGIELFDSEDLIKANDMTFVKCDNVIDSTAPTFTRAGRPRLVNASDVLLTVLAHYIGCDFLATHDLGFKGMNWMVKPLLIGENY